MKVTGIGNVLSNLARASTAISKSIENEVKKAAFEVEREAKKNITDFPAVDTGTLRGSIEADKKDEFHYEVGTKIEYAEYVEFGTHKMRARPYLGNAIATIRQKYPNLIKEGVKRA